LKRNAEIISFLEKDKECIALSYSKLEPKRNKKKNQKEAANIAGLKIS
jgi:hypothetical protein